MSFGEPVLITAMIAIPPMRMEDWFAALAATADQFRSTPSTNTLPLSCEREIATLRADSIFVGSYQCNYAAEKIPVLRFGIITSRRTVL